MLDKNTKIDFKSNELWSNNLSLKFQLLDVDMHSDCRLNPDELRVLHLLGSRWGSLFSLRESNSLMVLSRWNFVNCQFSYIDYSWSIQAWSSIPASMVRQSFILKCSVSSCTIPYRFFISSRKLYKLYGKYQFEHSNWCDWFVIFIGWISIVKCESF